MPKRTSECMTFLAWQERRTSFNKSFNWIRSNFKANHRNAHVNVVLQCKAIVAKWTVWAYDSVVTENCVNFIYRFNEHNVCSIAVMTNSNDFVGCLTTTYILVGYWHKLYRRFYVGLVNIWIIHESVSIADRFKFDQHDSFMRYVTVFLW